MRFVIFLVSNIIISYYLEKKSKFANICFSILFSIFLFFSLFICDLTIITNISIKIFGIKTYSLFNEVFHDKFEIFGFNYSIFGLTQLLLALSLLLAVIVITFKLKDIKLCIKIRKIIILITDYIGFVSKIFKGHFQKIYLRYERFRL